MPAAPHLGIFLIIRRGLLTCHKIAFRVEKYVQLLALLVFHEVEHGIPERGRSEMCALIHDRHTLRDAVALSNQKGCAQLGGQ